MKKRVSLYFILFTILLYLLPNVAETASPVTDLKWQIASYINSTWDSLTRNNSDFHAAHLDPKLPLQKHIIYISRKENLDKIIHDLSASMTKDDFAHLQITYLPKDISQIKEHGLLYLPYPYVVPGGRFNEMYGWDSCFIVFGLLENNRLKLAKSMIEDLIYEVNFYGTILNANRTYYLQRSQPPLLTEMILAYYNKTHDKKWLQSTLPAVKKLYQYWMMTPRYVPEIGLSRYYANGAGPTPEESPIYYEKVLNFYQNNAVGEYNKSLYYDQKLNILTPLFYVADRTVRESGFDITAKYGPFGASILDYVSVDLNVLLYQMEKQTGQIYTILGNKDAAVIWSARANKRSKLINQYLWDPALGYYFDYNIKTKHVRNYIFATTFYPLWAGIASKEQASIIIKNLPVLLAEGGIVSSIYTTQVQWDAPFGWAPFQYFAVNGLLQYGYNDLAKDVAKRFIKTVTDTFQQTHLIFEKYDVENISMHTSDKVSYGYNTNEIGFGWTNAVYLMFSKLLNESPLVTS
jgi:alpha,alpha-trehalase